MVDDFVDQSGRRGCAVDPKAHGHSDAEGLGQLGRRADRDIPSNRSVFLAEAHQHLEVIGLRGEALGKPSSYRVVHERPHDIALPGEPISRFRTEVLLPPLFQRFDCRHLAALDPFDGARPPAPSRGQQPREDVLLRFEVVEERALADVCRIRDVGHANVVEVAVEQNLAGGAHHPLERLAASTFPAAFERQILVLGGQIIRLLRPDPRYGRWNRSGGRRWAANCGRPTGRPRRRLADATDHELLHAFPPELRQGTRILAAAKIALAFSNRENLARASAVASREVVLAEHRNAVEEPTSSLKGRRHAPGAPRSGQE